MNKKYFHIISQAQQILVSRPPDLAHEITHHYRVYENCLSICATEKLKLDLESLCIAAWWHDIIGRNVEEPIFLASLMKKDKYQNKKVETCLSLISEHSFGQTQTSVESKVLFDADKLEYVNPFRLKLFIDATKAGLIDQRLSIKYCEQWYQRVPSLVGNLHFQYSRNAFEKMLVQASHLMDKYHRSE